jgi:hypothetical protein
MPMKSTTKALLIGLLAATGAPAAFAQTPPETVNSATTPVQFLGADFGTVGSVKFSGVGTGTANNSVGTNNSINLGTNSTLSIGTSLATSAEYAGTGSVSATVGVGKWNQTFGISSTTADNKTENLDPSGNIASVDTSAVKVDGIDGKFIGSFETTGSTTTGGQDTTKSDVTLTGVSNNTGLELAGSSMSVATSLRTFAETANGTTAENGTASASGMIGLNTAAAASVSASDFSSSFIQTFTGSESLTSGVERVSDDFYDTKQGFYNSAGVAIDVYDASNNKIN